MLATWSGDIPNGTVWTNTEVQQIVGDVRVPAGATLTIQPGTMIKFNNFAGIDLLIEGRLLASGTAAQPIVFTSFRDDTGLDGVLGNGDDQDSNANGPSNGNNGDWNAVQFLAGGTGSVLDHVQVRYGGSGASAALVASVSLTLTNSVVRNSSTSGVRIQTSNPTLTTNTFENNSVAAISMNLASNPAISGVTVTNNGANALILDSGSLVGNGFWNDPDIVYRLTGDVTVPAGSTLTVGAGQIVKFRFLAGDDLVVDGTLNADGTPAQPIIFTADQDDSAGGDTNNNGISVGSHGYWNAIQLRAGSSGHILDNVEIRFGGAGNSAALVASVPMTLTNSVVRNSSTSGVRLQTSNSTLSSNTFQNNLTAAISMDLASNPAISGVTVTSNGANALILDSGSLVGNGFWNDPDIVYRLTGPVTVPAGSILTVGAGQVVKRRTYLGDDLLVNGTLIADGTPSQPIIFTSFEDDTAGGDSNNNGSASLPGDGTLGAIKFSNTSVTNVMDYVDVRYGGYNNAAAVIVDGGALTMTNSVMRNCGTSGLRIQASNPTLTSNTFRGNATAAISMDLASNPAISGVTVTGNGANALILDGGNLVGNGFWNDPDIVYRMTGAVTVPVGSTLTIGAGQIVKGRVYLGDDLIVNGTLIADGTASQRIIFTSMQDDTVGGDSNNDFNASLPGDGTVGVIKFSNTSTRNVMDNVEVRYGGYGFAAAVIVDGGAVTLTNSMVRNSGLAGLRVQSARPTVTSNVFEHNGGAAISINVTGDVATSGIIANGNGTNAIVVDGGTIAANQSWSGRDIPYQLGGNLTVSAGVTLTVASGTAFEALGIFSLLGDGTVSNAGTILKSTAFTSTIAPLVMNTGTIKVLSGTMTLSGGVTNNRNGLLVGPINTTLAIGKNFAGNTQNLGSFAPLTTVLFNGTGTASAPQLVEVLSGDKGNAGTGFDHNFAFYSLSLGNNTFVKLIDNSNNTPGSGAEAVYVSNLVTASGTTLDLNGLHLYARSARLNGTVIGGTVSILPDGGPLGFDTVTPGKISAAGEIDDWTIFGRAGQTLTITVSTGTGGTTPPVASTINFAQVKIFDPSNNFLGTASNTTSGLDVTLAGITLPADGTYHIKLQAPTAQANSTGNYVITAWNATVNVAPIELGRTVTGTIDNPFRIDRWNFSAAAGQVVKFNLVNAESSAIQFDLTGPNGFTAFSNASTSSTEIVLPSSGTYSLTVHSSQRQTGAYAFRLDQTTVTELTLGTPLNVSLVGGTQTQFFRVNVPQSQQLQINLTDNVASDRNEVYLKFGSAPSRSDYQHRFSTPASANQQVNVPSAAPGNWYVLVYTEAAQQPGSFNLKATLDSVLLTDVTPHQGGTGSVSTLTLTGLGFNNTASVSLVSAGNNVFPANSVHLDLPTQLTSTFNAGAVPVGTYSVLVNLANGGTALLSNVFTMVQGGQAHLETNLVLPSSFGYHNPAQLDVQYSNTGTVAMLAPLLVLVPTQTYLDGTKRAGAFLTLDQSRVNQGFWTSASPDGFSHSILMLASGATPGVLQPGESIQFPVYYAGWELPFDLSYPPFHFNLLAIKADDSTPLDWIDLKQRLPISPADPVAADAIFDNVKNQMGNTWGEFITRLGQDAAYLGRLGEHVTDAVQLLAFENAQANGAGLYPELASAVDAQVASPGLQLTFSRAFTNSISGRYQLGALGRGWAEKDGWQSTLTVRSDGTVLIQNADGAQRQFQPDSRGGYFAEAGDHGVLTAGGGAFAVRELNGLVTAFRADGKVDYATDSDGNRINASYTGGLLTSLTHSSGRSLQMAYNTAGRLISLTDPAGRVTQYGYDTSNEHLLTVTNSDGQVTSYTYSLGGTAVSNHALLSVGNSDGTHLSYGYDSRGRLNDVRLNNSVERMQFAYGQSGTITITDAVGGSTTVLLDHRGLVAGVEDPIHGNTYFTHDNNFNLTGLTDASGQRDSFTYDNKGSLTRSTNPRGNNTQLSYSGSFAQVNSITDPKGNSLRYGYDARGNLTSTTYADGTVEQQAYDPGGNLVSSSSRRGPVIQYAYDSLGRPVSKTYADASQVTYVYDTRDNLTSTTDAAGTTNLTYDANDRLIQITYPGGRYLRYQYDTAGRRTQMSDQTNFIVTYSYDAAGRLAGLTDGSGNSIVGYIYDATGQLQRKNNGNGTYATYQYDVSGQMKRLTNFTPSNSIDSRFDYNYDALGRAVTITSLDGQWTNTYDGSGQLTRAVFASNDTLTVPNQNLQFDYDAAGNRTSTVVNGLTTAYVTNNLNQYASAGTTTYGYDADGNQIRRTDGPVTTTYSYDTENNLIGVSDPSGTWTYQYDAFGNRVATTHNGQTTQYVIDPSGFGNVVGQYDQAGNLQAHYTHGLGLTSRRDGGNVAAYYDFDAGGNTVALTNTSGTVVNNYRYFPNGSPLTTNESLTNPFQFGGESGVMNEGNGLQFMRARFYDPAIGRFTQMDPIGVAGGLNLYGYAGNDPVNGSDPSGLSPTIKVAVVVARNVISRFTFLFILASALTTGGELAAVEHAGWWIFVQGLRNRDVIEFARTVGFSSEYLSRVQGLVTRTGHTVLRSAIQPGIIQQTALARVGGGLARAAGVLGRAAGVIGTAYTVAQVSYWAGGVINNHVLSNRFREGIGNTLLILFDRDAYRAGGGLAGIVSSRDPNDKIGPEGFGTSGFIDSDRAFPYRINFENDKSASAPAQRVTITDPLSTNLDWNTFQLSEIGFGDTIIPVPPGSQHFETTVPMTLNGTTFDVQIEAGLRLKTGEVFTTFQSIDPLSELPPDVLTGFLPPENDTGRGQGHVSYSIRPKANLPTGTQIRNVALITFDFNETIATDQIDPHDPSKGIDTTKQALNTIDSGTPTSSVVPLPAQSSSQITVNWSGVDDSSGSGIASYSVFVSDNNEPFVAFVTGSTATTAVYTGTDGHTYRFYSVATDNVGHVEATPATFDAITLVVAAPWQNNRLPNDVDDDTFMSPLDVLAVVNELNSPQYHTPQNARLVPRTAGKLPYFDVDGDGFVSPLDALIIINAINRGSSGGEGENGVSTIHDDLFADTVWLDDWLGRLEVDSVFRNRGTVRRFSRQ